MNPRFCLYFLRNISPKIDKKLFVREIVFIQQDIPTIGLLFPAIPAFDYGVMTKSRAAISFVLAVGAMIAAYFDERIVSSFLFLGFILLIMGSILLFTHDLQVANTALDVHLSDLETHQEWEQYLRPKRRSHPTMER